MTRCWDADASKRPSMEEVVNIMSHLMQFFPGAEQPIIYPGDYDDVEEEDTEEEEGVYSNDNSSNSPGTMSGTLHLTSSGGGGGGGGGGWVGGDGFKGGG